MFTYIRPSTGNLDQNIILNLKIIEAIDLIVKDKIYIIAFKTNNGNYAEKHADETHARSRFAYHLNNIGFPSLAADKIASEYVISDYDDYKNNCGDLKEAKEALEELLKKLRS